MNHRRSLQILAVAVTILLVAVLITRVSVSEIVSTLLTVNPVYLLAGFCLYIGIYIIRAWRFHILLNREVSTGDLFVVGCVHNMLNNLLPARTGELSYVWLLNSEHGRPTGEGLGTLIIARIFDFITITFFFLVLFLSMGRLSPGFAPLVPAGILFLFCMVGILAGLLVCGETVVQGLKRISPVIDSAKFRPGAWLTEKSEEIIACFAVFRAGSSGKHIAVIALSLGIWIASYLMFALIARSMGIDLGIIPVLFGSSFAVFSTVLPIQGIAGFGTMEGGWALGFVAAGATPELAVSTGFGFHLIMLGYTLLLGVPGYLYIFWLKKGKKLN